MTVERKPTIVTLITECARALREAQNQDFQYGRLKDGSAPPSVLDETGNLNKKELALLMSPDDLNTLEELWLELDQSGKIPNVNSGKEKNKRPNRRTRQKAFSPNHDEVVVFDDSENRKKKKKTKHWSRLTKGGNKRGPGRYSDENKAKRTLNR